MAGQNINNQILQYAMQNGMTPVGRVTPEDDKDDRQNEWQRMLSMLAMSNQTDPLTMAGFLLGNGLGGLGTKQKAKVDARGEQKESLFSASPEERQRLLADIEKSDPPFYQRLQANPDYADWFNNATPQPTIAQPDLTGINPNARAVEQAMAGLLGDPKELVHKNLPVVDKPFQQPDYSFEDEDKWNMQDYIKRLGWNGNAY